MISEINEVSAKKHVSRGDQRYDRRHPIVQFRNAPPVDTSELESFLQFGDHLEKKDLAIFSIMHCVRRMLPYGSWRCADGREVLFNREYQPIAQRINDVVSYADRDEWVENIKSCTMYYDDGCNPADYLVKHLGYYRLSASESKECRAALLRTMKILKEFTPAESQSVSETWSLLGWIGKAR